MFSRLQGYLYVKSISVATSLCPELDINTDEYVRVRDLDVREYEDRQIWSASIAPVPQNYWSDSRKCPRPIPDPTMTKLKQ